MVEAILFILLNSAHSDCLPSYVLAMSSDYQPMAMHDPLFESSSPHHLLLSSSASSWTLEFSSSTRPQDEDEEEMASLIVEARLGAGMRASRLSDALKKNGKSTPPDEVVTFVRVADQQNRLCQSSSELASVRDVENWLINR